MNKKEPLKTEKLESSVLDRAKSFLPRLIDANRALAEKETTCEPDLELSNECVSESSSSESESESTTAEAEWPSAKTDEKQVVQMNLLFYRREDSSSDSDSEQEFRKDDADSAEKKRKVFIEEMN